MHFWSLGIQRVRIYYKIQEEKVYTEATKKKHTIDCTSLQRQRSKAQQARLRPKGISGALLLGFEALPAHEVLL